MKYSRKETPGTCIIGYIYGRVLQEIFNTDNMEVWMDGLHVLCFKNVNGMVNVNGWATMSQKC